MARVLLTFAHPAFQTSRVHRRLVSQASGIEGLTLNDLYEAYPDYDVDVEREKRLLLDHDVIVWQHPLYWYSVPPLLKQWMDLVLEHGWAYGSTGTALRGKVVLSVVSAGGPESAYLPTGHNRNTIPELLRPLERTASLCGMDYLPPWVVFGTHRLSGDEIAAHGERYRDLLRWLVAGGHTRLRERPDLLSSLPLSAPAASTDRSAP